MTLVLNAVAGALYLFAALAYFFQVIFAERKLGKIGGVFFMVAFGLHTGLLAAHFLSTSYPFILGEEDFLYLVSWVVAAIYVVLRRLYPLRGSGTLFATLTLVFFVLGEVLKERYQFGVTALTNPWALVHVLFMSLAFAVFTVSFLVGLTYLYEERKLKSRRPGRFLAWLPSLETMDGIHYKALTVGFVLLSIGILAGAALSKATAGKFFSDDPRQVAAIGTWALYAVFLNVRLKSGWRGRKGIILSILGFIGVLIAFLTLEHRVL